MTLRLPHKINIFRSTLRKNFAWTFVGNMVSAGCQWSTLSVLAKLTSPDLVGQYAFALALTAPLMMLASFNIGVMLVTDLTQRYSFVEYRRTRLLLMAVSFSVIAIIASHYSFEVAGVILFIAIAQLTDSYSEIYYSLMQRRERMETIALSLISRGVLSLSSACVILFATHSLLLATASIALSKIIVLVAYDLRKCVEYAQYADPSCCEHMGKSRALARTFQILATVFPLSIVTILTSLTMNTPRYFIEHYAGHKDLGIFAALWSLLTAGNMIAIALGQSMFPRLSRLFAEMDLEGFKSLIRRATLAGIGIGVAGVLGSVVLGRFILRLVYGPVYAEYSWLFTAIMGAGTLMYLITLLGFASTAAKAFKEQAVLMGVVVCASGAACFYLVPSFGLWGAVASAAIAAFAHITGLLVILFRLIRQQSIVTVRTSSIAEAA